MIHVISLQRNPRLLSAIILRCCSVAQIFLCLFCEWYAVRKLSIARSVNLRRYFIRHIHTVFIKSVCLEQLISYTCTCGVSVHSIQSEMVMFAAAFEGVGTGSSCPLSVSRSHTRNGCYYKAKNLRNTAPYHANLEQ